MSTTTIDPRDLAFERLYRRYARDVYRFALGIVHNPQDAEDVTQTAFLNAYRAYQRGERPDRPQSWLIAIAHNAIRSRRRWTVRRPKEVAFEDEVFQLAVAPAERSDLKEVLRALGQLPLNQREALAMRELEGRTYPEIAETLGVTVPAVESLIHRARRTLRARRTSLRGLILLQLPRSLRTWFEQGDPSGVGLAAKAVAVAAAATVVAGGIGGGPKSAGAAQVDRREPAAVEARHGAIPAPVVAAAVVSDAPSGSRSRATTVPHRGRPPAPPQTPATAANGEAPTAGPATGPTSGSSLQAPASPSPSASVIAAAPTALTTAVATAATTPAATAPAVTTPAVTTPAATIDLPPADAPPVTVPQASVPGVSVPQATVPPVTVPQVTVPPASVPPVTVPQVPAPSGIK